MIKAFVNTRNRFHALGLAYVAEKVRITEGSLNSNLAPPLVDEPSLKLVPREPSLLFTTRK
jgi:hypothetical protein